LAGKHRIRKKQVGGFVDPNLHQLLPMYIWRQDQCDRIGRNFAVWAKFFFKNCKKVAFLSLNSQLLISNFFQILFGKAPFWATS
jgi:hypothetical protein